MPLSLFDVLKASTQGGGLVPSTDSQARITLETDEAPLYEFRVRDAQAFYRSPDTGQWNAIIGDQQDAGWVITLTQKRLLVWSPLSPGLMGMGQMKLKSGKATGGHVRYNWVDEIMRDGALNLCFMVDRKPEERIKSMMLSLDFADTAQAHNFCVSLADLLVGFQEPRSADLEKLAPELDKLRNAEWSTRGDLKLSLLKAGAKVDYAP